LDQNAANQGGIKQISVEILIMAVIGLVLGLLGPFGSYEMPTALRLVYWIGFILIGYAIFRPIIRVADWLHEMTPVPFAAAIAMAVAVAALPLTFLIGFAINGMTLDGVMMRSGFALLYAQCAGVGIAIFLLMRMVFPVSGQSEPFVEVTETVRADIATDGPASPSRSKLHDRLPVGFPDEIIALGVEDHYVRVHSAQRSEMLLMRLRDAITELDGIEAMQVHRSWWVAGSAIKQTKKQGRNLRIVLNNGLEVPVSRAYVAALKKSGWI